MRRTEDEFKKEIFHRKDLYLARKKCRQKQFLTACASICIFLVIAVLPALNLFPNSSFESAENAEDYALPAENENSAIVASAQYITLEIAYGTDPAAAYQLSLEESQELINFVSDRFPADNITSQAQTSENQIQTSDKSSEKNNALQTKIYTITFTYEEGREDIYVLQEQVLYSVNQEKSYSLSSDEFSQLLNLIQTAQDEE